MLETSNLGGVQIFRPSKKSEDFIYLYIKKIVFERYAPGTYNDIGKVTEIVNSMFNAYDQLINEYLSKVDNLNFAAFLCQQYEQYAQAAEEFKAGNMSDEDEEYWQSYASHARRGIKYLLELICSSSLVSNNTIGTMSEQEEAISILFIVAEELVQLYMRSELYRSLLDKVTLVLNPSKFVYFHVEQDLSNPPFDIRQDVIDADKYIPQPNFLRDTQRHNKVLGSGFTQSFGVDFLHLIGGLQYLIDNFHDQENPGNPCFVLRREANATLAQALSITTRQAALIIDGFSLSAQKMREEGRQIFRPKQEYRAYKRALFVLPDGLGDELLMYSWRMAKESLVLLIADIPFRKIPPEWKTDGVGKALNTLSLQSGRWFENVVQDNLDRVGIRGVAGVKHLVFKDGRRLDIPAAVGEIDFIGLCPKQKLLVVVEAKQVNFSTEPRLYKDDLDSFITSKHNYSDKFEAKYLWVQKNHKEVTSYLAEQLSCSTLVEQVGYAMITHFPMYIARKISRFSCLSITEFMRAYEAHGIWPCSKVAVN